MRGTGLSNVQDHWQNIQKSISRAVKALLAYFFSLNIARKLMLGFIPLVVLLILISAFALLNLNRLNSISDSILKTDVVVIATSEKMIDVIFAQELFIRRYLILKTIDLLKLFRERDRQFNQLVAKIRAVPEDRDFPIDEIASLHGEYNDILLMKSSSLTDSSALNKEKIEKQIKDKQDAIIALIKEMAEKARLDQNKKTGKTSDIGNLAFNVSVVFCVIGFFLSVAAAMLITRNISGAVKKLRHATEIISKGEFDYKPDIRNSDELGDLSKAFIKMAKRLKQLEEMSLDTSPLTRLPGGISIEKKMQERITSGEPTAFCMVDIDDFKTYNDYYGYAKGNELIKATAKIILDAVATFGTADDFIGHIGGDDFVIITKPDLYEKMCSTITAHFDKSVLDHYDDKVKKRGYIIWANRKGEQVSFPITSLSIAAVTNAKREFTNYLQFGEVAAEVKKYAKSIPGSVCVVDRRTTSTAKSRYLVEMASGPGKARKAAQRRKNVQ
jgi:diguanylate cyclase (GGDEF)-like protein